MECHLPDLGHLQSTKIHLKMVTAPTREACFRSTFSSLLSVCTGPVVFAWPVFFLRALSIGLVGVVVCRLPVGLVFSVASCRASYINSYHFTSGSSKTTHNPLANTNSCFYSLTRAQLTKPISLSVTSPLPFSTSSFPASLPPFSSSSSSRPPFSAFSSFSP